MTFANSATTAFVHSGDVADATKQAAFGCFGGGELASRAARIELQLDPVDRGKDENADIAVKAFELSQNLATK